MDVNPWVLGFQQPARLLDVASAVKEHTVDASTPWIKAYNPWIKQRGNIGSTLLATINKMVGTWELQKKGSRVVVRHQSYTKNKTKP